VRPLVCLFCAALGLFASPPHQRATQLRIPVWLDGSAPAIASEMPELRNQDFHVNVDGSQTRVLDVQCPGDEMIVLLVLDLSSGDLTIDDPARENLLAELHQLSPKSFVGLLRAQDSLQVLSDPTADRDAVAAFISQPTLSGNTALLSTVETMGRIADSMLRKSSVRVSILYITDGDVRNYREDFANPVINASDSHDLSRKFPETLVQEKIAKVNAVLVAQQAPLFIVDLNQKNDRLNAAYHNGLKELAEATGGAAFFSRSTTEIPETIHKSFAAVASYYGLTLELPARVSVRPQIRLSLAKGDRQLIYRTRVVLRPR